MGTEKPAGNSGLAPAGQDPAYANAVFLKGPLRGQTFVARLLQNLYLHGGLPFG
jgi:hypothetical protein